MPGQDRSQVSAYGAVRFRQALEAADRGDRTAFLGHVVAVDADDWPGIAARLALLRSLNCLAEVR